MLGFSVGLPPTTHHHGPVQRRCDHCKDRGSHWCSVSTECGQGVVVIELLEKVKTNEHEAKELCKSIANTVTVINSWHIVGRIGEERAEYFACICSEMEQCLIDIEEQLNDEKRKCRGFKKILTVNDFHDAIETYRRHVEDLKTDFLISITGECLLKLCELMAEVRNTNREGTGVARRDETMVHISINRTVFFALILF